MKRFWNWWWSSDFVGEWWWLIITVPIGYALMVLLTFIVAVVVSELIKVL